VELLDLQRQFSRAVAPLEIGEGPVTADGRRVNILPGQFTLDVAHAGRDESFVLRLGEGAEERWRFMVANAEPARRHLLFVAALAEVELKPEAPRHFLCGHDERHLFVAGPPYAVTTVAEALDALKPLDVLESEARHRIRERVRNRHRNAAFVRQGEWFFLPRPSFVPSTPAVIHRDEPISRGHGKAHVVEYLYRGVAGETVWVCPQVPEGVSEQDYQRMLDTQKGALRWRWRQMRRTAEAYARGRVRHPDHATIVLPCWHQIALSREAGAESRTATSVAFLD